MVEDRAAAENVAAALRSQLLDGALPPGSHLSEEQLAGTFGVSRYTIRAALRLLVTAGLLVHERHRGAFVPELTQERIDELFAFRGVIELGSLRLALERGLDSRPIEAAVVELERVDSPDRTAPWHDVTAAHKAIHHAIVAAAGNPRLLAAYAACEDELQVLLAFIRPEFEPGGLAHIHRDLLAALHKSVETAHIALADDLEVGRKGIVRALARSGGG